MGLSDVIRAGVGIASTTFQDVKVPVVHRAWIAQAGDGEDTFASPVTRLAIVDQTRKMRYTKSGKLVMTTASIIFLDPIDPNGAATRQEPIDTRDSLVLADGSTGPIVSAGGVLDSATGRPFVNEVLLGEPNQT